MDAIGRLRRQVKERGVCGMASVWYVLLLREIGLDLEQAKSLPDGSKLPAGVREKLEAAWQLLKELEREEDTREDLWDTQLGEYCRQFTEYGQRIPSMRAESGRRLRSWFLDHPGRGWDDVLAAVKLYLANVEPKYVSRPNYFVRKKVDGEWVSLLDSWLEKVDEQRRASMGCGELLID